MASRGFRDYLGRVTALNGGAADWTAAAAARTVAAGTARLPAEVWLDAAGLARRISVNSEPTAATDAQVWSVVELWDFGVAVDITPPGPGEVLAPSEAYRLAEEESHGGSA